MFRVEKCVDCPHASLMSSGGRLVLDQGVPWRLLLNLHVVVACVGAGGLREVGQARIPARLRWTCGGLAAMGTLFVAHRGLVLLRGGIVFSKTSRLDVIEDHSHQSLSDEYTVERT